ncbi:MAG: hypothetical protein QOD99_1014 [Chthoniobacter sp.]|nr:hypothetical protein [Chthoniobacter sp.]
MPYMWGGFSSFKQFNNGIKNGVYAGDVCTAEKRRLLDEGVSKYVVGIDCSGLISRCWKLERSYSTREFPQICYPLSSYADLRAGDILNCYNNHVLLFKEFTDASRQRLLAYEAGSPPTWKVLLNDIPVSLVKEQNFKPYRFKGIAE